MTYTPTSIEDLQQIVCSVPHLLPTGGCTKTALSSVAGSTGSLAVFEPLSLRGLSGILAYEPQEFTFSALSGTPLSAIQAALAENGQYLPFDPPFAGQGATLGGCVASGLSGPGRLRSGGVRDFILGVSYVDSQGRLVMGGGNVVKNAAGFDLPKLMTGSLGSLGILAKLTFKVFPRPEAFQTIRLNFPNWESALESLARLAVTLLDLDALDLAPSDQGISAWIRLYGMASILPAKMERLRKLVEASQPVQPDAEESLWQLARDFTWAPAGWSLVKVPITPAKIPAWERALNQALGPKESARRYSGAGQVCWLSTPADAGQIEPLLKSQGLNGLVVLGQPGHVLLGDYAGRSFYRRVKSAMDPVQRFREVDYAA